MANGENNKKPHFLLTDVGVAHGFTSPKSGGRSVQIPPLNRATHSASLLAQLTLAKESTEAPEAGLQIEFRSFPDIELATESLARDPSGIELLNVREDAGMTLATVYIPDGKLSVFEKLIADYVALKRDRNGRPIDNQKLIDAIREIRVATVRALWTDSPDALPPDADTPIAWEVWLPVRSDRQQVLNSFRQLALGIGWRVSSRLVEFPERTVLICIGTQHQLEQSAHLLSLIAELRRGKETAAFFDELTPFEQAQWVDELVTRLQLPEGPSPFICILDTGVNRGHPLLTESVASTDLHSVEPVWGPADANGHGTEMAGVALFGDLVDAFTTTGAVAVSSRLESVKILRAPGDNDGEPYGAITQEAVSRTEVTDPNRVRVFQLAVTATDSRDRGRPSSWSASIDGLAADALGGGARPRLFVISAGNCNDSTAWLTHPAHLATQGIHDPAQSWNALTVGAYTDKAQIADADTDDFEAIAVPGSLSPFTTTSVTWQNKGWPWKPDLVFEGGNAARDGDFASTMSSLSVLTTHRSPLDRLLTTTNATSAATALGSRMAGQIRATYPKLWPETVRALLVHSARWTDRMKQEFSIGATETDQRKNLLRHCGYGVPDLGRALWSASDSLTLVVQDSLQPFQKTKDGIKTRDMHLHALPWPLEALQELGNLEVSLRVTLSYFVEPNPGARGHGNKYTYQSHALRFEVRRPSESPRDFMARINRQARDEEEGTSTAPVDTGWTIGDQLRRRGSIHSDVWKGRAIELANRGQLAIYPAIGWWRRRPKLERYERVARYSLIVSIEAPDSPIDLYAAVEEKIAAAILV